MAGAVKRMGRAAVHLEVCVDCVWEGWGFYFFSRLAFRYFAGTLLLRGLEFLFSSIEADGVASRPPANSLVRRRFLHTLFDVSFTSS
jgi:hypothetical protein